MRACVRAWVGVYLCTYVCVHRVYVCLGVRGCLYTFMYIGQLLKSYNHRHSKLQLHSLEYLCYNIQCNAGFMGPTLKSGSPHFRVVMVIGWTGIRTRVHLICTSSPIGAGCGSSDMLI